VDNMEHEVILEVAEACIFRATTHHSDGVDVFIALKKADDVSGARVCQTSKHPGPVPRQSIFCLLQPGRYSLIFFADYPLGGLHPCSDFFVQSGVAPRRRGCHQEVHPRCDRPHLLDRRPPRRGSRHHAEVEGHQGADQLPADREHGERLERGRHRHRRDGA
ncbi:unnamed protein product, partial [Prorocentrum cordatum]